MVNRFEQTIIWQKTLGQQIEYDSYEKERACLRIEFENFREKAKLLAAEISKDLPDFTIHDITHIDALWETAELVTKGDFELTPAEAFVLGGAFLIHDLGMGLASFPDGIEELKKETIWKDTVVAVLKEKGKHEIKEEDFLSLDKEVEKKATEKVLRLLHAKHAEKLAQISWKNDKGEEIFLIENSDLRESYGRIIGLIAYSHWWSIDELEDKLPERTLGAPGKFPSNWTVDPVKLACVLRIADAIQIDDRRANSFLRAVRKPDKYSDTHWNFQQKLYQPRLEQNRIVYTSKSSFSLNEIDSWWVCYDTLQMIDKELKDVDSLLSDTNRQKLKAIGVASVENATRLSKLIAVSGWQPVDAKVKVTNVAKLVGSLGGKQLYGDNTIVPLRELIQNASDAIRARRVLENETDSFGDIIVRFGKDDHGQYIEVEDNGIGMSSRVLTGPFLDFGESFWGTSLMHEELPGLESRGFTSSGQYGIGFFSVFMWGKRISVASRRFEKGRESTLILEFNNGICSRPVLRQAKDDEVIKYGGTRLRVWLSDREILDRLLTSKFSNRKITGSELIEKLCPSIDCNVFLEEKGKIKPVIKANDWISIKPINLLKRVIGCSYYNAFSDSEKQFLKSISKHMSIIKEDNGTIVGRLLLYKEEFKNQRNYFEGVVTVGGFMTSGITGLLGILIGKSDRASRDIGIPIISDTKLKEWATDQAVKLSEFEFEEEINIDCARVVRTCGGHTVELGIGYHNNKIVNYEAVKEVVTNTNLDNYIIISDSSVSNYERKNNCKIKFLDNVFVTDSGIPGILQTRSTEHVWWPESKSTFQKWFHSMTLKGLIIEAILEVWGNSLGEVIKVSNISSDDIKYDAVVGYVDGEPVNMEFVDIIKKPKQK